MKHAGADALDRIAPLLGQLRKRADLQEKRPGVFYWKSRAFLHFHEDPKGIFADVRLRDDFTRLPVNTKVQRETLLGKVDRRLARGNPRA